jgi:hypothetical protein
LPAMELFQLKLNLLKDVLYCEYEFKKFPRKTEQFIYVNYCGAHIYTANQNRNGTENRPLFNLRSIMLGFQWYRKIEITEGIHKPVDPK